MGISVRAAELHRRAADKCEEHASLHDKVAVMWEDRGEVEQAAFERLAAALERAVAALDRERARVLETRVAERDTSS